MFTAFLVAAISLIIQRWHSGSFIRWIKPDSAGSYAPDNDAASASIEVAKGSVDVLRLTRIIGPAADLPSCIKWNAHRITRSASGLGSKTFDIANTSAESASLLNANFS